jgi:hypothetical protein
MKSRKRSRTATAENEVAKPKDEIQEKPVTSSTQPPATSEKTEQELLSLGMNASGKELAEFLTNSLLGDIDKELDELKKLAENYDL